MQSTQNLGLPHAPFDAKRLEQKAVINAHDLVAVQLKIKNRVVVGFKPRQYVIA
jgi:hypothetical protein